MGGGHGNGVMGSVSKRFDGLSGWSDWTGSSDWTDWSDWSDWSDSSDWTDWSDWSDWRFIAQMIQHKHVYVLLYHSRIQSRKNN